jgi:GNAT superfamily N-acetyltransferase
MIKLKHLISETDNEKELLRNKISSLRNQLLKEFPQLSDLEMSLHPSGTTIDLMSLRVFKPERGKGIGRVVISKIKQFADENNLTILLSPSPERGYKKKLSNFYKSQGFVNNKGKKIDYRIHAMGGPTMYRRPGYD